MTQPNNKTMTNPMNLPEQRSVLANTTDEQFNGLTYASREPWLWSDMWYSELMYERYHANRPHRVNTFLKIIHDIATK